MSSITTLNKNKQDKAVFNNVYLHVDDINSLDDGVQLKYTVLYTFITNDCAQNIKMKVVILFSILRYIIKLLCLYYMTLYY